RPRMACLLVLVFIVFSFFFFQAEDGIRDRNVTGVQTCALPICRKVKAAFKAKFAVGERIGAYAPIGYRKHPKIKNKLIIDEETRWIVERIFDLAVHGIGAASITRILIEEKVPTPG